MENKETAKLFSQFTVYSTEESLRKLNCSVNGLTHSQATKLLQAQGHNEIGDKGVNWWVILWRQFKSPFIYLLVAAGVITGSLGEYLDTIMIVIFICINTTLGFIQEFHSEKSVALLKNFIRSRVRVKRDNSETLIDSRDLVPGDIVILEHGDIIPADVRWLETHNLSVDEEVLTGESVSVSKDTSALPSSTEALEKALMIGFSGTTIASGRGLGLVIATGGNTYIGGISRLTDETTKESVFSKDLAKFSSFILRLISYTLILVVIANLILKRGSIGVTELVIFALALAVSVIPEALPLVTTVALSRSARRLAKNKVVVKRLSAIEDLGSIQVLCTDKTGTLTENNLTVAEIHATDEQLCLEGAAMAAIDLQGSGKQSNNAFDLAIDKRLTSKEKTTLHGYKIIDVQPFDPKLRRNAVVVQHQQKLQLIVRGAPEAIWPLSQHSHEEIAKERAWLRQQGREGKRVMAIACRDLSLSEAKLEHSHFKQLTILGYISFIDPIKPSTRKAVLEAQELGVEIKILTGDSPDVAGAVAHDIGLIKNPEAVITGEELEALSVSALHEAVTKYSVFARVTPEQKYKIIQLLQERREVGFLGEGINDAPALKIANVALAVESASDVAREAADIVLLKKSLHVIIEGIREGREVFANTIKYIKATLGSNLGNFYSIAIASLMIDFLPLLPLQILLVNLLSDVPMISIATDTVNKEELKSPKQYQIRDIILFATLLGFVSSVFDFLFFGLLLPYGQEILQSGWFIGSILTELLLIFSVRSSLPVWRASRPGKWLFGLTVLAMIVTVIIPFWPVTAKLFSFVPLSWPIMLTIVCLTIAYLFATEMMKRLYQRLSAR